MHDGIWPGQGENNHYHYLLAVQPKHDMILPYLQ